MCLLIGHHRLQPPVLFLELAQPAQLDLRALKDVLAKNGYGPW
jgi:hypothetical protein